MATAQLTSHRSSMATVIQRSPVTLMWENLVYKIKPKSSFVISKGRKVTVEEKHILKGTSGVASPGEILAMIGSSGSGKTTLLTALAGRLSGNLSGTVTYNNKPFSSAMKRNIGFVAQDDVLSPHLTVYETLYFTALLRLPSSLTRPEKAHLVNEVMEELGLNPSRNTLISGHLRRGVSGGERKRVSIGQEMMINPSLIFLDEPTSGLDSTTAQMIVNMLSEIAKKGDRTVVMTVHQPSSRMFNMFHKIVLLFDGTPLYYGMGGQHITNYFADIGYSPPLTINPADFLLDLSNGIVEGLEVQIPVKVKVKLSHLYETKIKHTIEEEIDIARTKFISVAAPAGNEEIAGDLWYTSWWEQFRVLLERGVKERRKTSFDKLTTIQITFISLISGALWWQSQSRVPEQIGLVFFTTTFWFFFNFIHSIFTFQQERIMLIKERSSGMYRLSSYVMARIIGDIHMDLGLPLFSVTILYWMAGLKHSAVKFLEMLLIIALGVLTSSGLGLSLGAFVTELKKAMSIGSILGLTFTLVGGFYVQKVPLFVGWIKYLSIPFHTFKLALCTQFYENETYECGRDRCFIKDLRQVAAVGLDGKLWSLAVLIGMSAFYRMVTYVALMNVGIVTK